jgi:hypothetical protein
VNMHPDQFLACAEKIAGNTETVLGKWQSYDCDMQWMLVDDIQWVVKTMCAIIDGSLVGFDAPTISRLTTARDKIMSNKDMFKSVTGFDIQD